MAVLGGAKVSDKIGVIEALAPKVDHLLIGGAMAYTFLAGLGHSVGDSLVEEDRTDDAFQLLERFKDTIVLPTDHVVADALRGRRRDPGRRPARSRTAGMGSTSARRRASATPRPVDGARTVIWNGPMGVFEMAPFAAGHAGRRPGAGRRDTSEHDALTVVGGGDSVAAINQAGLADAVTHVSTGGGAMLEFMEGKTLPGLAALD